MRGEAAMVEAAYAKLRPAEASYGARERHSLRQGVPAENISPRDLRMMEPRRDSLPSETAERDIETGVFQTAEDEAVAVAAHQKKRAAVLGGHFLS